MMVQRYKLFVIGSLLSSLVLGCGDKDGGNEQSDGEAGSAATGGGASGSSGTSASGQGGDAGTTAGAGGSAGSKEPTPPPENPRELGPPDGIYCESSAGVPSPVQTCPAGARCCPYFDDEADLCVIDGGKCQACNQVTCGQILCDGPEDCSAGQFCCYANQGSCKYYSDCTAEYPTYEDSYWIVVECQERCVGDQRDPDHGMVVCKDDRDCPGPYVAGRCRELNTGKLPIGLKACFSSGT